METRRCNRWGSPGRRGGISTSDRSLPISLLVCRPCTLAGSGLDWARVGRAVPQERGEGKSTQDLNINEEPLKTEGRK